MLRLVLIFTLALPPFLAAAPDPLVSDPVQWRVLVRTPRHPIFNEGFHERLSRELKAALQPVLGLPGTVEVMNAAASNDPMARAFHSLGWPALDANASRPLDNVKHHGLNIELRDNAYVLSCRQLDGFSGLASPMLRSRTVRTLDMIPRAAGLLIEPDFGATATIERHGTDETLVMLTFRGHKLGAPAVKAGDIFAVSVIRDQSKLLVGTPIPYTFVRTLSAPENGQCQALILSRWANPFGRDYRRAAALRAMKLSTVQAPLRVKLVDRNGKPHLHGSRLTLTASDADFNAKPTATDGFEWREGVYHSLRSFSHVACLTVSVGADRGQLFPVPILGEDTIVLAFDVDPAAERRAEFLRDCIDLRARIADLSTAQLAMVAAINQMLDTARNRDALTRAEAGKEGIAAAEKILNDELQHLLNQPGVSDANAREILESGGRQLAVIREGQAALAKTIESLKTVIANSGSPAALEKEFRVNELVERIRTNLARGDVPEALAAYDALIALQPNQVSLKDEREKLLAEWTPKNEEHRAARDCIRTLANARQPDDFAAACQAIKKAVAVLKRHNDRHGLRKLLNTFETAIAAYYAILNQSDQAATGNDKNDVLDKLNETLTNLRECESLVRLTLQEVATKSK